MHAADVVLSTTSLIANSPFLAHAPKIDLFALLIAAAVHGVFGLVSHSLQKLNCEYQGAGQERVCDGKTDPKRVTALKLAFFSIVFIAAEHDQIRRLEKICRSINLRCESYES